MGLLPLQLCLEPVSRTVDLVVLLPRKGSTLSIISDLTPHTSSSKCCSYGDVAIYSRRVRTKGRAWSVNRISDRLRGPVNVGRASSLQIWLAREDPLGPGDLAVRSGDHFQKADTAETDSSSLTEHCCYLTGYWGIPKRLLGWRVCPGGPGLSPNGGAVTMSRHRQQQVLVRKVTSQTRSNSQVLRKARTNI